MIQLMPLANLAQEYSGSGIVSMWGSSELLDKLSGDFPFV